MEEKPTVYVPFFTKQGKGYEKHETRCVSFTPRQVEKLTAGLDVTTQRTPYVALTPAGSHSVPVFKYTYGSILKDGVLQGVFLISKGAYLYAVK